MKAYMSGADLRAYYAKQTCQRSGPAFTVSTRKADWRFIKDIAALIVLVAFGCLVLTIGALVSGGA